MTAARLKKSKHRCGKNRRRELNRRAELGILHEEGTQALRQKALETSLDNLTSNSAIIRQSLIRQHSRNREARRIENQDERARVRHNVRDVNAQAEEALTNKAASVRYESMRTAKGRDTMQGPPPVNVCDSLEKRELVQPGRKTYRPGLVVQSSAPAMLYYIVYVGLLYARFFWAEYVPVMAAVVNWQGSAFVAMLSFAVMIAGTRLYNGTTIATALLFALQAVGAVSGQLVGPVYYLSLLFPPVVQRIPVTAAATIAVMFTVTRLTVTSNQIAVRPVKKRVNYVAGSKQRRVQAAVNAKVLKQFNITYIEVELVDDPGTIIRGLLDSGAALPVFSLRSLRRVWHTMKRTLRSSAGGDSMQAVGGGGDGMGPNVGLAYLKFRFVGHTGEIRPEIMDWPVEVVDNDDVPNILGVDLLKHLGATL